MWSTDSTLPTSLKSKSVYALCTAAPAPLIHHPCRPNNRRIFTSQRLLKLLFDVGNLLTSSTCADLLEVGRPENVQLLRAYLAMEHEQVMLEDWLGQTSHL